MKKLGLFFILLFTAVMFSSCSEKSTDLPSGKTPSGSMELSYATQFSVDYYDDGTALIKIGETDKYLLIPENSDEPENIPDGAAVIRKPVENIYAAASSALDLFDGIDSLDSVRSTSIKENDWSSEKIRTLMKDEKILYAGKYSAPDYELLLSENTGLAVESTMIYHSPDIKEMLENVGITVLVERSSYEAHPLGRLEWIKLYGLLVGKEKEAEAYFNEKTKGLDEIFSQTNTEKTAAFFYIGTNGAVNVRKPGDYISEMIEISGGRYIFSQGDLKTDDNALSTINIQFEAFYSLAEDSDFLIYNSTVDGGILTIEELVEKNKLLESFKAVQNGNVWCTDKDFYREPTGITDAICELNAIFNEKENDGFKYFFKVN